MDKIRKNYKEFISNFLRKPFKRKKVNNIIVQPVDNILNNVGELLGFSKLSNDVIMKKYLRMIEIELFSYCNRQCWFCPNSFIDRHSNNYFMEENLYLQILQQLKSIDYSNIITYSRYNEPLSKKEHFIKSLKLAREYCPNAVLRTNSNGDFLNSIDYLNDLSSAGLNELEVQCYLKKGEKFDKSLFISKADILSKKLNLEYKIIQDTENCIVAKFDYLKLNLLYNMYNFENIANNRGNSLKNDVCSYTRTKNCIIPFQSLYIDYNGDAMLCCNLRHDIEEHKPFIIGNANNNSIQDIFMGENIIKYRKLLCTHGEKFVPCNSCKFFPGSIGLDLEQ